MDTLRVLEGACLGINLLLQSLDYLESKSPRLVHILDEIRSILEFEQNSKTDKKNKLKSLNEQNDSDDAINKTDIEQIQVQKMFKMLTKMRNISFDPDEDMHKQPTVEESENGFDAQYISFITIINSIIDNNSGIKQLKEIEVELNAPIKENNPSHSNRKRKTTFTPDQNVIENDSAMTKKAISTLDNSCKKPKPKSPIEVAMEIDVVLMEIFRRSVIVDLKKFRGVNKKWNETATSVLLSKKSLRIRLDVIGNSYKHREDKIQNRSVYLGSLQDLGTLMESSSKFPCTSIVLFGGRPHDDEEFKQFLYKHGHYFKEFIIQVRRLFESTATFLFNLLTSYAPNLEILEIDDTDVDFEYICNGEECFHENDFRCFKECMPIPILPNLKNLVFKPRFEETKFDVEMIRYAGFMFFKSLLKSAVNLQSVETIDFDFLEEVMDTNKESLIRNFYYEALEPRDLMEDDDEDNNVAIVDRLVNLSVKLTSLVISFGMMVDIEIDSEENKPTVVRQINSILNGSKESLKSLKTEGFGTFPGISIPSLPNLIHLVLKEKWKTPMNALFPPTFSFTEHMPNLHKIRLFFHNFAEASVQACFPGDQAYMVCNSVQYLELEGSIFTSEVNNLASEIEGAKRIAKMFPNVKSLKIADREKLEAYRLSPILWYFCPDGLRSLDLYEICCTDLDRNIPIVDNIDPFFTGIPKKICKILRRLPADANVSEPESVSLLNIFRTHRSIYDLKELQELNIFCNKFTDSKATPFASHVTGMCAFGLMPKLKVTLTYNPGRLIDPNKKSYYLEDIDCCLEPIASYIKSVRSYESYYHFLKIATWN